MYAQRIDMEDRGRLVAELPRDRESEQAITMPDTAGYPTHDDITDWVEDFDMSLAPAPQREAAPEAQREAAPEAAPRRSGRTFVMLAVAALLIAMVAALGLLALALFGAVVALLMVPVLGFVLAGPDLPADVVAASPTAVVQSIDDGDADAQPRAAEPAKSVPSKSAPAKTPAGRADAGEEGVEADLVLMPDPAFDGGVPIPEAIRRLKEKVVGGEIDSRVGE